MTDLYALLPQLYRARDAENGYPLRRLLRAVSDQHTAMRIGIETMYDNWFIETCADDLVPYFADLVGLTVDRTTSGAGVSPGLDRAAVGNAILDRRAKGTAAAIEQLSADVTGWPARVVEIGRRISAAFSARFPDLPRVTSADLRGVEAAGNLDGPFSTTSHRVDVRATDSTRTPGGGSVSSIFVELWRLRTETALGAPAARVGPGRYTFDALGRDVHLAVVPTARRPGVEPTGDLDVPGTLTRLSMSAHLADFYGPGRSLLVHEGEQAVARHRVVVADLSDWRRHHSHEHVCIDPVLGRISLRAEDDLTDPSPSLRVDYSRLSVGAAGSGYLRYPRPAASGKRYLVSRRGSGHHRTITAAIESWESDRAAIPAVVGPAATIEILDNDVYAEHLTVELHPGERIELRAGAGFQPVLTSRPDRGREPILRIVGATVTTPDALPAFTLHGMRVHGAAIELSDHIGRIALHRCTLTGEPRDAQGDRPPPAIRVRSATANVSFDACVLGSLHVEVPKAPADPVPIMINDSVIDAGPHGGNVITGREDRSGFAVLAMARTTVLGRIYVHSVSLVQDCIVTGRLDCEFRQHGHIDYCYLDPDSRTPRRDHCQPERAIMLLDDPTPGAADHLRTTLVPRFDSTVFDHPTYARLAVDNSDQITAGAHDGGELGAFHDLWAARRTELLRRRLADLVPPGMDVDIRFAT